MSLRFIKKLFIRIVIVTLFYFMTVAIWAMQSVNELSPSVTTPSNLTTHQQSILLKIEDPTFYIHRGIDISQGQGLTTITSSIARDIFLFGKELTGVKGVLQRFYRGIFNCCKKVDMGRDVMAVVLNLHLSKAEQLNFYVANTYFGRLAGKPVIGIETAAKAYFQKDIQTLTEHEFIGLVAMIKAPNQFHPHKHTDIHAERTSRVEKLINGKCQADGWFDTTYENCTGL